MGMPCLQICVITVILVSNRRLNHSTTPCQRVHGGGGTCGPDRGTWATGGKVGKHDVEFAVVNLTEMT